MKKTVFISSTYEDLAEHRHLLWGLLEWFDVRVRGMEEFGARTESPLETCLSEVKLADIYIGIIAFRLGSIDKSSGKSFTQLEYEKASELKKEIRIYLIDEENAKVKSKFIDKGKEWEKLEAFKKMLKEDRTVATFISKKDLAEKIERDLNRILGPAEHKKESREDESEKSARIIERLLIAPLSYSGNELRLQIKIESKPYAASKGICEAFNLTFGAIIGLKIKIINPEGFEDVGLDELYMSPSQFDDLLPFIEKKSIEIFAKPQFTGSNIIEEQASFKPKTYSVYVSEPSLFGIQTRHREADGKIVLLLSEVIEKKLKKIKKEKSSPGRKY